MLIRSYYALSGGLGFKQRQPFSQEADWAVTSIDLYLVTLLARATVPAAS